MKGNIIPLNEWEVSRLGRATASRISVLFTDSKTKNESLSQGAKSYANEKLAEIMTGTYRSMSLPALEWGVLNEPLAALEISKRHPDFIYLGGNNQVFFKYTTYSGGSPDGYELFGYNVYEIKCPENPSGHVENCLLTAEDFKSVHKDYFYQLQFNMLCVAKETGKKFEDMRGVFVSYCPFVREGFKDYHEIEIMPCPEFKAEINTRIDNFTNYLIENLNFLQNGTNNLLL